MNNMGLNFNMNYAFKRGTGRKNIASNSLLKYRTKSHTFMSATNYDLFKKVQIYDTLMFQIIIKNKLFLKLSKTHIGKKVQKS